jgi:hypothetical protein
MLRNELLHKPFGYLFEYAELALDVLEISNRSLEQLNVFEIRCQEASFVYRYIWQHSKPILVFVRASVSFVYNSPDCVSNLCYFLKTSSLCFIRNSLLNKFSYKEFIKCCWTHKVCVKFASKCQLRFSFAVAVLILGCDFV